jgi:hypothetical protein
VRSHDLSVCWTSLVPEARSDERLLFKRLSVRKGSVAAGGPKNVNDCFQSDPAVDPRPRRFPIQLAAPRPQAATGFSWLAVGNRPVAVTWAYGKLIQKNETLGCPRRFTQHQAIIPSSLT